MARGAAAKEEEVKVSALELEESRSIEQEEARTVSRVINSQNFHEVMELVGAHGGAGPASKAIFNPNLVTEPVQACDGAVTGQAGDAASVTNKAFEDEQKTTISDSILMGNAAAVTIKASKDERKTIFPKLGKHAKARCSNKKGVVKKGKDKKGKQKEVISHDKPPILADYIPEPIATLDLRYPLKSYKKTVNNIKKKFEEESSKKFIIVEGDKMWCIPVTPGPDDSPSGVYVIKLTDGEHTLLLVAQKYQTWFRCIVTTNGEWFEIEGMEPKMIAGSKSLYTRSRYDELLAGNTVDVCKIGFGPLKDSFRVLARHVDQNMDKDKEKKYKNAIAVLLVMLFEAPRFPAVFEKNMKLLRAKEEDTVGENLKMWINNWCDRSMVFYMAKGEEEHVILTDQTSEKIREVATGVSLLCGSNWIKWQEANSMKKKKVKISTRSQGPEIIAAK